MGELAAIGKRCLHYGKNTCPLLKLNLTEYCHCIFWEASAEYTKQMEEEAALRRKEWLMRYTVSFDDLKQRYEIITTFDKGMCSVMFLPLKSLNDPVTGRWMLETLLNRLDRNETPS